MFVEPSAPPSPPWKGGERRLRTFPRSGGTFPFYRSAYCSGAP